jgi:hypothetical protein
VAREVCFHSIFEKSFFFGKLLLPSFWMLPLRSCNPSASAFERQPRVSEGVVFRQEEPAGVGLGFDLPSDNLVENPAVARIA